VGEALIRAIAAVARQQELGDFNTVFNTGAKAGQSVFHVHAHLLAGVNLWRDGLR
jgi:histidine triad (HIT) family protein